MPEPLTNPENQDADEVERPVSELSLEDVDVELGSRFM
jgi:hypothetical protein